MTHSCGERTCPISSCSLGDFLWPGLLHGAHIEIEQALALVALFLILLSKFDHLLRIFTSNPSPLGAPGSGSVARAVRGASGCAKLGNPAQARVMADAAAA